MTINWFQLAVAILQVGATILAICQGNYKTALLFATWSVGSAVTAFIEG